MKNNIVICGLIENVRGMKESMTMKKKVLIGFLNDGKAGGVDKYILSLVSVVNKEKYSITLLTKTLDTDVQRELVKMGISTRQHSSAKNLIKQYKELKYLMYEEKYDVVYFNMSMAIMGMGVLAAKNVGIKKRIIHSHSSGCDSENIVKRIIMTILHTIMKKVCLTSATTFIACSEKAGEWMYTAKILKSENYHVIHNTTCFDEFKFDITVREQVRKKLNLENKKVIVHVAGFTYVKNHKFIIDVMNKIVQKDENTILFLVGKGGNEEAIRKQVNKLGLEKHVIFTGQVNNVTEYLQAADIFVLASYFEGYPISALEAQVNGLTCILSDTITRESKITTKCYFLPLKKEIWSEFILKLPVDDNRETEVCIEETDNMNLNDCIIKFWEE